MASRASRVAAGVVLAYLLLVTLAFLLAPPWGHDPWPPHSAWQVVWLVPLGMVLAFLGLLVGLLAAALGMAAAGTGIAFMMLMMASPLLVVLLVAWLIVRSSKAPTARPS